MCLIMFMENMPESKLYSVLGILLTWSVMSVSGRVKQYQGFVPWEAALVPAGTFLALSEIAHNLPGFPASLRPSALDAQLDAEAAQTIIESVVDEVVTHGVRRARPSKRYLAGIMPLRGMRLAMGIFVPESAADGIIASFNTSTRIRKKVAASVRKVIRRLQTEVSAVKGKRRAFEYRRAFNGLSPLEAVYIPRGYYIPLTSLSNGLSPKAIVDLNYLSGIRPLDVVTLPGGIFVPHRMNGFPELPSEIIPIKPTDAPVINVDIVTTIFPLDVTTSTTVSPATSALTSVPVGPGNNNGGEPIEPPVTDPTVAATPSSLITTPSSRDTSTSSLDCISGPNVIPGCTTTVNSGNLTVIATTAPPGTNSSAVPPPLVVEDFTASSTTTVANSPDITTTPVVNGFPYNTLTTPKPTQGTGNGETPPVPPTNISSDPFVAPPPNSGPVGPGIQLG